MICISPKDLFKYWCRYAKEIERYILMLYQMKVFVLSIDLNHKNCNNKCLRLRRMLMAYLEPHNELL